MVIERIEGDIVIIEQDDGTHIKIQRQKLPENIKEGVIVNFKDGEYFADFAATEQRRKKLKAREKKLAEKKEG
jgi:hypothetical protein